MTEIVAGLQLQARWRDDKWRDAEVVEKKEDPQRPGTFLYYVHYIGCKCEQGAVLRVSARWRRGPTAHVLCGVLQHARALRVTRTHH